MLSLLNILRVSIALLALTTTSVLDLRQREVEPKLWLAFGAPLALVSTPDICALARQPRLLFLWLASSAVVVGLVWLLYARGAMGGGDLAAVALVSLTHPTNPLKHSVYPFPLLFMLYSSLALLCLIAAHLVVNVTVNKDELRRLPDVKLRIVFALTALPLPASRLARSRFWYLLERVMPDGTRQFRTSFSVDEELDSGAREASELLQRGLVSPDTKLWATYGLPMLVFLCAGYVLALVLDTAVFNLLTQ